MKNLKRIGALLLAIVMMLSMMSITAFAEETAEDTMYQETDPYVYVFMDSSVVPDEWKGKKAWYLSSHRPEIVLKDSYDIREGVPTVIPLYNSSANEMIKTYCIDLQVETVSNTRYRRLNLEDSTYFSDENAELLRAIFLNGFIDPADTSDLQNAANEWLADKGMEQITDLTSAQALSATQYAIWLISTEDEFADSTIYKATVPSKDRWLDIIKYTDDPNPKETAVIDGDGNNITEKNITLFAEYLLNLDGVAPSTVLISDATLADAAAGDAVLEDDGTYSVTVTVNIDGVKDGDELYLTVASGEKTDVGYEKSNTVAVTASGEQAVTLTGLTEEEANGALSVEINGQQTGSDVYMFDAPGNRGTSQTMIGYDNSVMPVHAKTTIGAEERILKIYKTTPADKNGDTALIPNIQFIIYQVATAEQIESGEVVVDSVPTDEDVTKYATLANEVVTITTDANGYAEYNFSRNGMPDGVYLVVEKPAEFVKEAAAPFYVTVPNQNSNSTDDVEYIVERNIENEIIYDKPGINESVTWIGNVRDTVDAGDTITWIIDSHIPFDIGKGISYAVITEVDQRLTVPTNVTVYVSKPDVAGNISELVPDTDCTIGIIEGENGGGKLTVTLTDTGMKKISEITGDSPEEYVIRISFQNVMNSNASVGENIPSISTVEYTNSVGISFRTKSEEVEVHTGGLTVSKVDDAGNPVEGAVFKVARVASDAEIADSAVEKVTVSGKTCVYVDFFKTEKFECEKVYEVTTDGEGMALIYGLAYGDYYVIEVSAPSDYIMDSTPIEAEVNAQSHTGTNVIKVVNVRANIDSDEGINHNLDQDAGLIPVPDKDTNQNPSTGDANMYIVFVAALMLAGSIVCLLAVNRKRCKEFEADKFRIL